MHGTLFPLMIFQPSLTQTCNISCDHPILLTDKSSISLPPNPYKTLHFMIQDNYNICNRGQAVTAPPYNIQTRRYGPLYFKVAQKNNFLIFSSSSILLLVGSKYGSYKTQASQLNWKSEKNNELMNVGIMIMTVVVPLFLRQMVHVLTWTKISV